MLPFLRDNARWLGFGVLLTFAGSFGQTWFISLFAGEIRAAHGLSDGAWGAIYSIATLASAALLFSRGALVDTMPLTRLTGLVAAAFALACLSVAVAPTVWLLAFGLFGLRFCGQGMFGHIAMVSMGRWFATRRGRAVTIAALGHSAGEMLLAIPAVFLIGAIGWRATWGATALVLLLAVLPTLVLLARRPRRPVGAAEDAREMPGLGGRSWTRGQALRHWLFPALLPLLLSPGFIGTVVFFHQVHVAEIKGWSLAAMVPGYAVFASVTVAASLTSGLAVDRFGPLRLLPLLLVPAGLGMTLLAHVASPWGWFAVLGLVGVTQGMTGALMGTLLPEVYGTRHLGAIRALGTTIMVVSTAIGPGLTGAIIDAGVSFPDQGPWLGLWCAGSALGALGIAARLRREITNVPA